MSCDTCEEAARLRAENERLRTALHVTITKPMGVVPVEAEDFYDPRHPALILSAQYPGRTNP